MPLFRKAGYCSHGHAPGDGRAITISGGRERAAAKHEARCDRARLFNHEGFLGRIVCCAGCGQKVC